MPKRSTADRPTAAPTRRPRAGGQAAPTDPPAAADTETRILDAARRVFVRRGTSGARMQEIAAEAGVNQALVHYYFGSKEALAERVFREAVAVAAQGLARIASPPDDLAFEEFIAEFVAHYIDAVRQAPYIPAYVVAEAHQHPERLADLIRDAAGIAPETLANGLLRRLEAIIAARVAAGDMRPIAPRMLLVNLLALCAFPFVARPMLGVALGMDDAAFAAFLDERKRELPGFLLNALRA